jgi:hypothetical protein
MLKNLERLDPSAELEKIFTRSIKLVNDEAKRRKDSVDWLCLRIDSALLDTPIYQNLHEINIDSAKSIVRKFELVDQSGRSKGRSPLIEEKFVIDITAVSRAALRMHTHKPTHQGSGQRSFQIRIPNKDPNSIIAVINTDRYCLFRAANLLRAKSTMSKSGFRQYYRDPDSQNRDLHKMHRVINFEQRASYAIEDFGFA